MSSHSIGDEDSVLRIDCHLWLNRDNESYLGDRRVALLEQIDATGSISQAAKRIGMSYKSAWDAVDAMNNLAEKALVVRSAGGRQGGGTSLTEFGRQMIGVYRFMQVEYQRFLHKMKIGSSEFRGINNLMRIISMKSSARNQLRGKVKTVKKGAVNGDVILDLGDGLEIFANITNESIDELRLAPGVEAVALIKSSFIILSPDADVRISARNRLTGKIVKAIPGAVNSEIKIELAGGRILTAIVTNESVQEFNFATGSTCTALIKASHVILAVSD